MEKCGLKTKEFGSTDWWTRPLLQSLAKIMTSFSKGYKLKRPLTLMSLCTGIGTEVTAARCIGVPVHCLLAAEKDPRLREVLAGVHGDKHVDHIFSSMSDACGYHPSGECSLHSESCTVPIVNGIDMLVAGPPCQPYSSQRNRSVVRPNQHHGYGVLFGGTAGCEIPAEGSLLEVIKARRPRGGIIEEVKGFAHGHLEHPMHISGQRSLQEALDMEASPLELLVSALLSIPKSMEEILVSASLLVSALAFISEPYSCSTADPENPI